MFLNESGSLRADGSSIKNHYRFPSSERFLIPTAHQHSGHKSPVSRHTEVKEALECTLLCDGVNVTV